MNKELQKAVREEKIQMGYKTREILREAFDKMTTIVFDNEILEKIEEVVDNLEFEELELRTVKDDYKCLKTEKAKNIDNCFKLFKIKLETDIDSRLQSFDKKFRRTINIEDKQDYLEKIMELTDAMVELEDYANKVTEDAVEILNGAAKSSSNEYNQIKKHTHREKSLCVLYYNLIREKLRGEVSYGKTKIRRNNNML